MDGPDPSTLYPVAGFPQVVFLRNVVTRPTIEVGEYSYYDDPAGAERFEERNVLYHYDFVGDRLIIGRYVAIACGAQFVMNGANHATGGFSTFPFEIFGNGWEAGSEAGDAGHRGDTIVGNDVWIGREACILPGARIGDGAIIGAHAVVAGEVAPYAIVVGNPARVVRMRFDPATIAALLEIAWWNWPARQVTENVAAIRGADLERLRTAVSTR